MKSKFNDQNAHICNVSSAADVLALGNTIRSRYRQDPKKPIVLRAIGAGAVNQAVKSVINAGQHFSQNRIAIFASLGMVTLESSTDTRATSCTEIQLHFQEIKL